MSISFLLSVFLLAFLGIKFEISCMGYHFLSLLTLSLYNRMDFPFGRVYYLGFIFGQRASWSCTVR